MLNKNRFIDLNDRLINVIYEEYDKGKYENCLKSITLLGRLRYLVNIDYCDLKVENIINNIVRNISVNEKKHNVSPQYVLFYDSFGLDVRGLALLYLKALVALNYNIIYVTKRKQKENIPTILKTLEENKNNIQLFIDELPITDNYSQLVTSLSQYNISQVMLYLEPYDLIGILLGYYYEKKAVRYQINLTDHAFWLGCGAFDYSIEFRDYGAIISNEFRSVEKKNIVKLPYYPVINKEFEFEGFPEETNNKKIIFSGGSLYKTLGDENKYYQIVEYLLENHDDTAFIYAGYGDDTEINNLIEKYTGRVFHINERKDLYEMMKHSYLYLSTYPMIGGLMTQYAVSANVLPFTLIYDDCGTGVLLNPEELGIEFYSMDAMLKEIDRCIDDCVYMSEKKKDIEKQLISEEQFTENLNRVLLEQKTEFNIKYTNINTEKFRNTFLERTSEKEICKLFGKKKFIHLFKYFPAETIKGLIYNIKEILCK